MIKYTAGEGLQSCKWNQRSGVVDSTVYYRSKREPEGLTAYEMRISAGLFPR